MRKCLVSTWANCYNESWAGLIVPEAFAHPAKFAPGFIKRIYQHCMERGYLKAGDTVVDPMCGVAGGAIFAPDFDLNFIGVELEYKFHRMATKYECPGITRQEWVRWLNRFDRCKYLCPKCQAEAQGWYAKNKKSQPSFLTRDDLGPGKIPYMNAHHYTGNLELHEAKWKAMGKPIPVILQGDSRELSKLIGHADGCVMSPPYVDSMTTQETKDFAGGTKVTRKYQRTYGDNTPGQLGAMRAGSLADCICTSPPHGNITINKKFKSERDRQGFLEGQRASHPGRSDKALSKMMDRWNDYGETEGQIGNLKSGNLKAGDMAAVIKVDLIATSPPWEDTVQHAGGPAHQEGGKLHSDYGISQGQLGQMRDGFKEAISGIVTSPPFEKASSGGGISAVMRGEGNYTVTTSLPRNCYQPSEQGNSLGQIANETGQSYWSACAQIYRECYKVLKPGGVMVLVLKSYIKAGKRVPLPQQTMKLLIHLGFTPLERIKAALVSTIPQKTMFGMPEKKKQRKSFFRRLHEKRYPHLAIDHEEVLIFQKGGE